MKFSAYAESEMKSTHREPQFYTQKAYFTLRSSISHTRGWISLKKALAEASAFFWRSERDLNSRALFTRLLP